MSRRVCTILCALVFAAGCAAASIRGAPPAAEIRPTTATKFCAESPLDAAKRFLRGLMEMSLAALRALVPDGVSILAVFGDGDPALGRKNALDFASHPARLEGNDVGVAYTLVSLEPLGGNEYEVLIERDAEIIVRKASGEEEIRDETHRRAFRAVFEPRGNCLTRVRAVDPEWTLMTSDQTKR